MLQGIFRTLSSAIISVLKITVKWFLAALDTDMATYQQIFPALGTGYYIFRGLGIGLVLVLAAIDLYKFFMPTVLGGSETESTPAATLLWAALSGGLVYAGNYILDLIYQIAKIPYDSFMNIDSGELQFDWLNKIKAGCPTAAIACVIEFAAILWIGWHLFKLILEVGERFMVTGVLLYVSPPFFAMFASGSTRMSAIKFVKSFISACVMMAISIFFLKLAISALVAMNNDATSLTSPMQIICVRAVLLVAICKVAEHADEYMNELGINTAPTGSLMLDDILAFQRVTKIGGSNSILGGAANSMSAQGGLAGSVVDSARSGLDALKHHGNTSP